MHGKLKCGRRKALASAAMILALLDQNCPAQSPRSEGAPEAPHKSSFSPVRDPFFPSRKIGQPEAAKEPVSSAPATPAVDPAERIFQRLTLKGFTSNPEGKRLALISGTNRKAVDFGVGEERQVNVDGEMVRIRCLGVGDESVTIQIQDAPARWELRFREGF